VYGLVSDINKTSPISGSNSDQNVFIINYSLNSANQDKSITNTDLTRVGWTFINAKEISSDGTLSIVGPYDNISG